MKTNLAQIVEMIDINVVIKRSQYNRVTIHQTNKFPNQPLSATEKDLLRQVSFAHCVSKYVFEFKKYLNDGETEEDLRSEAHVGFEEMLIKFDKQRMKPGHTLSSAFEGTWATILKYHTKKTNTKTKELREG